MQSDASGARLVQARKRRIVDRDAGKQVSDLRRVRWIKFGQLSRKRVALDLETFIVGVPLRQEFLRPQLLQPKLQRWQCSPQTVPDELGVGARLPGLLSINDGWIVRLDAFPLGDIDGLNDGRFHLRDRRRNVGRRVVRSECRRDALVEGGGAHVGCLQRS